MAEQYTPTTEAARQKYVDHAMTDRGWPGGGVGARIRREAGEEFDRMLAAHDAQVLRYAAKLLRSKPHHVYETNGIGWMALDTRSGAARVLDAEADRIEEGTSA
jgi:hypothetical protein